MALNTDGTATCDRCGIVLDGYGISFGMCTSDIVGEDTPAVRELIFCYVNQCRTQLLKGRVIYPQGPHEPPRCTLCGVDLPVRAVSYGLIAADVAPVTNDPRLMIFCYVNHSREDLLSSVHGDPT